VQTYDRLRCIQSGAYLVNNCGVGNTDVWYTFDVNRRGTPLLRSETGDSWTVGFVWDVLPNLSVSADYWAIKLEDMIVDVGADEVLASEAGCLTGKNMDGTPWANPAGGEYCAGILARVNRDSNGRLVSIERGPFNLASREVRGIDLTARYRLETAQWGSFQLGVNYTNQISTKEQRYAADPNRNAAIATCAASCARAWPGSAATGTPMSMPTASVRCRACATTGVPTAWTTRWLPAVRRWLRAQ
jgi:outer membrane receptor protein involved in Fe transport